MQLCVNLAHGCAATARHLRVDRSPTCVLGVGPQQLGAPPDFASSRGRVRGKHGLLSRLSPRGSDSMVLPHTPYCLAMVHDSYSCTTSPMATRVQHGAGLTVPPAYPPKVDH